VTVWYSGMDGNPWSSNHTCISDGHLLVHTVTYARCRTNIVHSPDDEHMVARNM